MTLKSYLPQDRITALASGKNLPDRTTGSVLFADISGFTPLTEGLRKTLGQRHGAEELTKHLEAVYTALIKKVHIYGGSVIGFAGDAITCWFDDAQSSAPSRAVTCAFAMQTAIADFAIIELPDGTATAIGLKVAIATGPARRFVVGDPQVQLIDTLVGATVMRVATTEHLAEKGEVLVDEATVKSTGTILSIDEWLQDSSTGERFARIASYPADVLPPAVMAPPELDPETLRPWILPHVYERERLDYSTFLTEFRPCTAMFVLFSGIDYEADTAKAQLDEIIRQIQAIADHVDGTLMQITIGDKGSYTHLNFGALSAHEDNSFRAVNAALALREMAINLDYIEPLQIGITQGMMCVGAFGSKSRKTYNGQGDDVNLAARLMTTASPGEILLSSHVYKAIANDFSFEPRPPLPIKGKAEPLPVFAVIGERHKRAFRLQEPNYALPMVGREHELMTIEEKLELVLKGKSQIIGIVADAGLGKSRLVAEVIRSARRKGFVGYGGACKSDALNTPYQAWKSILSAFFDVDTDARLRRQIRSLEGELEDRVPHRVQSLPLLGALLNISIPDNEFTQTLEPETRQNALHILLEDCLKAAAQEDPLLIVIEDMHWIDALSYNLLVELARATTAFPICFVLAYRPPQLLRLQRPRLESLPQFKKIKLSELNNIECEQAIRAKLIQLYPAHSGIVPPLLVEKLIARAQGNPFYLEELLNYLRDRGLDPRDPKDLNKLRLPDSLHTLILSRIDQLSESKKITLRVASIIGRSFRVKWLLGYYPDLGSLPRVKSDLDELDALDITPLEIPEPELAYLFKHIITHEVTYESLPFTTRAQLHEQLANYLEESYPKEPLIDILAYHYGSSGNKSKKREYYHKAGIKAQSAYANDSALAYYRKLLPLLTNTSEQIEVRLKSGEVLELIGEYEEAEGEILAALDLAIIDNDLLAKARCQTALSKLFRLHGDYDKALEGLADAFEAWKAIENQKGMGQVLIDKGFVLIRKGEFDEAHRSVLDGLKLARTVDDKKAIAVAFNHLGIVANIQGDYPKGQKFFEESLALRRELDDKRATAKSLLNLGLTVYEQGNLAMARTRYMEGLALFREIGDKWAISATLTNLGLLDLNKGNYRKASDLLEESLALQRELGDKYLIATSLNSLGLIANAQGKYPLARTLYEESLTLRREIDDKRGIYESLNNLGIVAYHEGHHLAARTLLEESLEITIALGDKPGQAEVLLGLGIAALTQARESKSKLDVNVRRWMKESLELKLDIGDELGVPSCLVGLSGIAIYDGDAILAAKLSGASDALSKKLQVELDIDVRPLHLQTKLDAQSVLGEKSFNAAWAEGEKLTQEEVVNLALDIRK